MPLIPSPRLTRADLDAWTRTEAVLRQLGDHVERHRAPRALDAIDLFSGRLHSTPCYCGTSWGKDSTVVAHLVRRAAPHVPLVWIRVEPIANPHCPAVRDAFIAGWPGPYDEIEIRCETDLSGALNEHGTLERGAREARRKHGPRWINGIRAEESAVRALTIARNGTASDGRCSPIAHWTGTDVLAYLVHHDLPIHPAYAMTAGGSLDPARLRVSALGLSRGSGRGRAEWERRYYGR